MTSDTPATRPYAALSDVDRLIDRYQLVVPPLPEPDAERRWCVVPWCRNDARPRGVMCQPHKTLATAAGWSVEDLLARELVKGARAATGCANPACPTPAVVRASRVPTTDRVRAFAVRRFWGHFQPGGEFLCKVCAALVNEVAEAFDPELGSVEAAVERAGLIARRSIPHPTYQRLGGQQRLRSKRVAPADLQFTDGFTLNQYVLGLEQYVGFWASIAEDRYRFRTEPADEVEAWLDSLCEAAVEAVVDGVKDGDLPEYTIPYLPARITLDAMLGTLLKEH